MISIIVGYRNRDLDRVKRSIASIAKQSYKNFELIFVDYGSNMDVSASVNEYIESHDFAKYIYVDSKGMFWNRAQALNIGTKYSSGDILLYYDIDLIIPNTFLEQLVTKDFNQCFYSFSCYYLNADYNYLEDINLDIRNVKYSYVGMCAISKQLIDVVDGYDEFYMVWGVEDDDLYKKLNLSGCSRIELGYPEFRIYHQPHELESSPKPDMWFLTMLHQYQFKKSITNILDLTFIHDRPARAAFLNGSYKNHIRLQLNEHRSILVYNQFMLDFFDKPNNQLYWFEYSRSKLHKGALAPIVKMINKLLSKQHYFNYLFIHKYSHKQNDKLNFDDVQGFIKYFIGISRKYIYDYNLCITENDIKLVIIKM